MNDTATTAGARAHARSQAGAATRCAPVVPATSAQGLPPGVAPEGMLWREVLGPGAYGVRRLPRGALVRLHDPLGDACAHVLVHNAWRPTERLNVADTVKVQWQAYLGAGAVVLSDMGRVLLTLTDDSSGRHDALCGGGNRRSFDARWGDGSVSGPTPNPRDLLVLAGMKQGLERRDVPPWINLFKSARVAQDGALTLDGDLNPNTWVTLRTETDVVVLLANTPHPLDDRDRYSGSVVTVTARPAAPRPPGADTPERERAYLNTEDALR